MRYLTCVVLLLAGAVHAGVIGSGVITSGGGGGGTPGFTAGIDSATLDPPSIPNGECVDVPGSVSNVQDGDYISAQAQCDLPPSVFVDGAWATGEGTLEVRVCNISTSGTEDPPPCLFQFFHVRQNE